jgi:hypothetical protein
VPPPTALIPQGPYRTSAQRDALARLGVAILAGNGRYRALEDILARARPRLTGGFSGPIQTTDLRDQRERAAALDDSYLFIQGPPGTGKTWTGARIIVDLIRRGRRVGVAATSHKTIHNLLDEIERAAREEGVRVRGLKKSGGEHRPYKGAFLETVSSHADGGSLPDFMEREFPRPRMRTMPKDGYATALGPALHRTAIAWHPW